MGQRTEKVTGPSGGDLMGVACGKQFNFLSNIVIFSYVRTEENAEISEIF